MDTSVPVRILSKPLPTLANATSHHGSNQGVIPHNQGVPHTERTLLLGLPLLTRTPDGK
jgi:hypothetical protein